MIVTDRFVYLHEPKTGGTFVRAAVLHAHAPSRPARLRASLATGIGRLARKAGAAPDVTFATRYGPLTFIGDKHGGYSAIPAAHRGKPILATVRNPYDLYVSEYEFGWWKQPRYRPDFAGLRGFGAVAARFPDIAFEDYVRLINPDPDPAGPDDDHAPIGVGAMKFYAADPEPAVVRLDDACIRAAGYRKDLPQVRFIATDRLNAGLYAFLREVGYRDDHVHFIRDLDKVRPATSRRRDDQHWQGYYSPELKRLVRERERMLFTLFPEFDV